MMRRIFSAIALLTAFSAAAQQTDAQKPVAVVNGETITAQKLNQLYDRMGTQMRQQYEKSGGKAGFLEGYVMKRLLIQEAIKAGFDKRPDIQADIEAARETTIFDRYVRDVLAAKVVNAAAVKQFYDQHTDEFVTPERIHVRHIVITAGDNGPTAKSKEQALEIIKAIAIKLHESNTASVALADSKASAQLRINQFQQLARQYSEDGTSASGGDLGWATKGQLDPEIETPAWALTPGRASGIIETKFGYHLILVEEKQPVSVESFEHAKSSIREYLLDQHASEVMESVSKMTNDLRAKGKVAVYPENIK